MNNIGWKEALLVWLVSLVVAMACSQAGNRGIRATTPSPNQELVIDGFHQPEPRTFVFFNESNPVFFVPRNQTLVITDIRENNIAPRQFRVLADQELIWEQPEAGGFNPNRGKFTYQHGLPVFGGETLRLENAGWVAGYLYEPGQDPTANTRIRGFNRPMPDTLVRISFNEPFEVPEGKDLVITDLMGSMTQALVLVNGESVLIAQNGIHEGLFAVFHQFRHGFVVGEGTVQAHVGTTGYLVEAER